MAKTTPTPRMGFVVFETINGKNAVSCLLGDGNPVPVGGYGGWEIKARARKRGLTRWGGVEPLQVDIPIIIDHFLDNNGVADGVAGEADIRVLELMAGTHNDDSEPPTVIFDAGGAVPHDYSDNPSYTWAVTNLQYTDPVYKTQYGNRARQGMVVSVMQMITDDTLGLKSSARKHKAKNTSKAVKQGAKKKRYTVKKGDTLKTIAAKQLGNASRWREIAAINGGIRDPKSIKVGQVLRLP